MTAWLASAGHCANIMRPEFTEAGYGLTTAGNGPYWAQVFARPMGVPAPTGPAVRCPRAPAVPAPSGTPAVGIPAPAPATPAPAPTAPTDTAAATAGAATSPRPKATATRTGRRLVVRVTMPRGAGRTAVVVRVTQRGRVVRTRRLTRAAGRTFRVTLALPSPGRGRVIVETDGRSASATFR